MAAAMVERIPAPNPRQWLGAFGILYTATVLGIIEGPIGFGVGCSLALVWYWFSPLVAFAFGHIALLVFPDLIALGYPFLLVEGGLGCLLVSSATEMGKSWDASIVAGGAFVLLAGLVQAGQELFDASWSTALLLTVVVVVLAYGLHRYERLSLGLVEKS